MKPALQKFFCLLLVATCGHFFAHAQAPLIQHDFSVTALPAGVTTNGTISTSKAADGVCSKGMVQVNTGQFLQVDVPSVSSFVIHAKSTSSSVRTVAVKYKKDGEPAYTSLAPLSISVAAVHDLTALYPDLVSSIPVSVVIEPTSGNIQVHDLIVYGSAVVSNAAEINSFKIAGQIGNEVINSAAGTIAINVPLGTPLTNVVPQTVNISSQATISPLATTPQDFTVPVVYTVTAQDGVTTKQWTVQVNEVASSAKEITAFQLASNQVGSAVINSAAGTIQVTMPLSASLTNIVPSVFTLSENATINPAVTAAQDFSSPVTYTVTAQDNSTKAWTVTVVQVDPNAVFTDYEAEHAAFTGTIDNNHAGFTGSGFINFLSTGDNEVLFTVCQQQAGSQTAKFRYALGNDTERKGALFVNDNYVGLLNFPRTATFTDWAEETTTVNLLAGINNIKIVWDTTDGPNLDKLMLTGAACQSYTLNVSATNGGSVTVSPERANKKYFDVENITLLAVGTPALQFSNWSGDLAGTTNPVVITLNANRNIVANFVTIPTYKLNVSVTGIGEVELNPAGGEYAENTVVTLTAKPILGSTFTGWGGDASGSNMSTTVTMDAVKNVTAAFSSSYTFDFNQVVGFAATSGDNFTGPTTGGGCTTDTLWINGPAEFNKLCEALYNRQRAYKNNTTTGGMKKAPLVIMLKAGVYDASQTLSTDGSKVYGNSMLDIPEQGDLTFMGESNVTFKFGINVKRSWNIIIRNITFQDYYDDGINIGGSLTHHIWVDHCTFGHPTTRPTNTEHPDGGCEVKDGASYVTVSWCVFRNSWKTSLIGHSDNNGSTDIGRLKVTMINNHFTGTNSRNPRVRFGEVHVVNNLAENVSLYGTVAANGAYVFAENNFFLNTRWPMYADRTSADFKAVFGNNTDGTFTSKTGNKPAAGLKQVGNQYDDSGLPVITAQINPAMLNPGGRSVKFDELNPGVVFDPSSYYTYTPMTAEEVRVIVPMFAGADKINFTNNCSTLPSTMLAVDVKLDAGIAKVTWQTTNEINTKAYEVERSANGSSFKAIGSVVSNNSTAINNYSFNDVQPLAGVSYYRIKTLDKDGQFSYSKIVSINNKSSKGITVYPNPAKANLTITHAPAGNDAIIRIISPEGKTVKTMKLQAGSTLTHADIALLAPGTYMLVLQNGVERSSVSFVKQ